MQRSSGNSASKMIDCRNCPLRQLQTFRQFDKEELAFISKFKTGELTVEAGAALLVEDNKSPHLYTILEGWAFRHKDLLDGKRQILNFALPGDLIGLQLSILENMKHSVTALTPVKLCVFERSEVWGMFKARRPLDSA